MTKLLLKSAVQTLFFFTGRNRAQAQIIDLKARYNELAKTLAPEMGATPVRVPSMPGVDENMRNWSFYQLLEHNRLVNQAITATTEQLARDLPLSGAATINPATDVLPAENSGPDELAHFNRSVERHLRIVATLGKLRGTRTSHHPLFGSFDAHKWNCMFAFHLRIHLRQAKTIVGRLARE